MNILRLREVLDEKNMLGQDLAAKIGVTPTTISNITKGNNFPKPETLVKIAEALDVDIRDLFISTREPKSETIFIKKENEFIPIGKIHN